MEKVISILKLSAFDPVFVDEAAKSFSIIAQGKGKAKQKTSHLTSRLLYAQKMWNHVLPRLIEGDADSKGRERLPYLVAFSSLLPLVPASLCLSDLPTVRIAFYRVYPLLILRSCPSYSDPWRYETLNKEQIRSLRSSQYWRLKI